MTYDVIIIGAGPAGSTAARECAARGLSVLLLDKAEFPRDKPCGGGVTIRAAKLLSFNISPVSERVIYGAHFTFRQSKGFTRLWSEPIAYLTQRRHLDTLLLQEAMKAGTELRERAAPKEIEKQNGHYIVRAGDQSFQGHILVAADGANGQTAHLAGINVAHQRFIALEGNITPKARFPMQWDKILGFDLGDYPGGFGWIFPKGDHLNIGVGGWLHIGPSLRDRLENLARYYGFDPAALWGLRGHHLPVRRRRSPVFAERLLLVGDAAGLIDPFTGEGIYAAVWSGQAAARHITAYLKGETSDLSGYQREVDQEMVPDLEVARQIHTFFHLSPGLALTILRRSTRIWRVACRILLGEYTYSGFKKKLGPWARGLDLAAAVTERLRPEEGSTSRTLV
ncbi:MAG: NAD(P)/FAD-dependent oxidoreductase [Chloroflexi bacterium]|nr:NAD(P)/FAD-dependent oxidoreductase [Chloroflexota bacterium]